MCMARGHQHVALAVAAPPSPPARRLPLTVPPPPARPPPPAIDDGKEFEAYIDASGRLVEEF